MSRSSLTRWAEIAGLRCADWLDAKRLMLPASKSTLLDLIACMWGGGYVLFTPKPKQNTHVIQSQTHDGVCDFTPAKRIVRSEKQLRWII